MIVLITYKENGKEYVSHGIDFNTMNNVVLPNETPISMGAVWNEDLESWVLDSWKMLVETNQIFKSLSIKDWTIILSSKVKIEDQKHQLQKEIKEISIGEKIYNSNTDLSMKI